MIHPLLCNAKPNFYPRSPCGERLMHALELTNFVLFLSTLSLRRATSLLCFMIQLPLYFYPRSPCGERLRSRFLFRLFLQISIHALLAESDRPRGSKLHYILGNFYPRSPCGERQMASCGISAPVIFLSTLSLRRATGLGVGLYLVTAISIHALLAESDGGSGVGSWPRGIFLSTLSLRRATRNISLLDIS